MKEKKAPISKVLTVILCMIAALFVLAACGGGSSPLVGSWATVEVEGMEIPEGIGMELYFSSDGTGVITESIFGETWEEEFTWSASGGVLTITDDWEEESGAYRISRNRLYLYDGDGEVQMILERQ